MNSKRQWLENVYIVFVADIHNLGAENVFVRKTVVKVFRNFMRICFVFDTNLHSQVNCFHDKNEETKDDRPCLPCLNCTLRRGECQVQTKETFTFRPRRTIKRRSKQKKPAATKKKQAAFPPQKKNLSRPRKAHQERIGRACISMSSCQILKCNSYRKQRRGWYACWQPGKLWQLLSGRKTECRFS